MYQLELSTVLPCIAVDCKTRYIDSGMQQLYTRDVKETLFRRLHHRVLHDAYTAQKHYDRNIRDIIIRKICVTELEHTSVIYLGQECWSNF